jgi:alkylation response protein AidB-like acyl-CoA dehydrogenase
MTGYTAPLDDLQFVLHDLLEVGSCDIPGYADLDRDFTSAILAEAGKLAAEVLAPLNAAGDRAGCSFENGIVRTPPQFAEAMARMREGGWNGLDLPPEYGGQGLPYLLGTAVGEIFVSANMAFNMYQGLTHGAVSTILAHGTEAQKAAYVPKMVALDWTGTMNLTEPQCGTDLGLIRTRAEPQPDGSFRITGQKIFISAGEHDLAENIIHLVLARAPGGGEGTRGISLFIVPKFLPDADGRPGVRNAVAAGKIETKMGIHANATCVMNYDGATGFLLGELHKGMRAMFTMMNEARLGVGLQGYALAEAARQAAAGWARERLQGRAVTGAANPAGPADPLIVHPDIRRSLMDQRAFVEGARALTLWTASLIDRAHRCNDREAEALVSLLTPIVKGFLTDQGFQMTVAAQQIFGGHGYVEDTGAAQFVRDARIAMIYEGANGIQAIDLVARKLGGDGGRTAMGLFALIEAEARAAAADAELAPDFAAPLAAALADARAAAMLLATHGTKHPDDALAGASDFLALMGQLTIGFMWTRMAIAAMRLGNKASAGHADVMLRARIAAGRHYMTRHLPATALHLARMRAGAGSLMSLPDEAV